MSTTEGVVDLAVAEADRLDELEAVVERGRRAFVEVGTALAEIRERRLYRATHSTFESYCRERWGFSRQHAYRAIDAAEVVGVLSPTGDIPAAERVARELVPLKRDHEEMREAWAEAVAVSNGQPTAAEVRERVDIRRNRGETRGIRATHHEPGWFEQLGGVGEALGEVERRLDRLGAAITRKPNAKFTSQAEVVAERAEAVAARLRELGEV